jgi:hypothetical protein
MLRIRDLLDHKLTARAGTVQHVPSFLGTAHRR